MFKLAFRNVFRHRTRTLLTLAAIVSGVVGLILSGGFIEDTLFQLREATIRSQLGHLQVYKAGYFEHGTQRPAEFLIDAPAATKSQLAKLPDVAEVMQRLSFAAVINNGRTDIPVIGVGIEPDKEARLGSFVTFTTGRRLRDSDRYGIVIGEGVASAAGLKPGSFATLVTSTRDGAVNTLEFEVAGVFRSFSRDYDARAVLVPLAAAQELLDAEAINAFVVLLHDTDSTPAAVARARELLDPAAFEVKSWEQLADFYDKTSALYRRQFLVLQAIIMMAVLLSVMNSVNMTVFERTGEFGTLMALGNRKRSVLSLVVVEQAILGTIGAALGTVLAIVLAHVISTIGIPMPPPPNANSGYIAHIRLTPLSVVLAFAIGSLATVAGALLPLRNVVRMKVVDALRYN